ncbi:MAG: hypothetical protein ACPL7D_10875, partial [Candidatus Sumerlaeaceae bacterium]
MKFSSKFFLTIFASMLVSLVGAQETSPAEKATSKTDEVKKPPELTIVGGRFVRDDFTTIGGGVVYFIFQERLKELPHENTMEKVRAMAETAAEVDAEGNFYLEMKPGNFALVYDPNAQFKPEMADPGPESMEKLRKRTPEQVKALIDVIRENAAKGLPIENGRIGTAYVVENRFVRPPAVDFGEMPLGVDQSATIIAVKENGEIVDFPVMLKLRGKNGDIYEPHTPTLNSPGRFVFCDLEPQRYDVFAIGVRMAPKEDAPVTTPTLENTAFEFEGVPI